MVIIDDVDEQGLNAATWKAITERVERGMGLMMVGGYHSFGRGGFPGTPIGDVLPIQIGPAQRQEFNEPLRQDVQIKGPVHMRPAAPLGERHPVMQVDGVSSQDSGREKKQCVESTAAAGWCEPD